MLPGLNFAKKLYTRFYKNTSSVADTKYQEREREIDGRTCGLMWSPCKVFSFLLHKECLRQAHKRSRTRDSRLASRALAFPALIQSVTDSAGNTRLSAGKLTQGT